MNFEMRCRRESSVIGTIEMDGSEALLTSDYLTSKSKFKSERYKIRWARYKRGDVVKCPYCGGMIEIIGDAPTGKNYNGHSDAAELARRVNGNDGRHSVAVGSEEHIRNERDGSSMLIIGMTKVKLG